MRKNRFLFLRTCYMTPIFKNGISPKQEVDRKKKMILTPFKLARNASRSTVRLFPSFFRLQRNNPNRICLATYTTTTASNLTNKNDAEKSKPVIMKNDNILIAENLPIHYEWQELKDFCKKFNIANLKRTNIGTLQNGKRVGIFTFSDANGVNKALEIASDLMKKPKVAREQQGMQFRMLLPNETWTESTEATKKKDHSTTAAATNDKTKSPSVYRNRILIIEDLPDGCTWQDLKDFLRTLNITTPTLKRVEVARQRDGTLNGVVSLNDASDVEEAMNLPEARRKGRKFRKPHPHETWKSNSGTRIVIHHLPATVKHQELKALIHKEVGKALSASVILDEEGKSRQFGYVEFEHEHLAKKAIEKLNNFVYKESKLVVREFLD
jgi:RNA recognition motif-containing protein